VAATDIVLSKSAGYALRPSKTSNHLHPLAKRFQKVVLSFWILPGLFGISARADDPKPETVAAFERYAALTEARMDDDIRMNQFLAVDRLPDSQRKEVYDQLQRGQIYIEELHTREDHHLIHIPSGLIHHWVGVIFIPKATLSETDAVLNDYENEPEIYKPEIRRAKLIKRNRNESKVCIQLYNKSIVTVALNDCYDVIETQIGSTRIQSISHSTHVAEVEDPGGPNEHERTDGDARGYMWRLYSYWRIEEKDGGVYVQNESITLTRTVPPLLAWLINPLTKSIPQDILSHMLANTQSAVLKVGLKSKH